MNISTKIICTIGPAVESLEKMIELIHSGMNVARINFSHGDYKQHVEIIEKLKKAREKTKKPLAIMLDTKGPEIRTMKLENGDDVILEAGQEFAITTDQTVVGNNTKVAVTYPDFAKDLKAGDTVLLDDGLIGLTVKEHTS